MGNNLKDCHKPLHSQNMLPWLRKMEILEFSEYLFSEMNGQNVFDLNIKNSMSK